MDTPKPVLEYIVTKQIAVKASSAEEAVVKSATEGITMTLGASVRKDPAAATTPTKDPAAKPASAQPAATPAK